MNIQLPIFIDDVIVGETRRELDRSAVNRLAESIEQIGLQHPITVREKGEKYHLIAGRHRLEACRKLGREHVPAIIVKMTNDEARLWEIAENLHRSDLKKLDRDEQLAEWIKITERVSNSQSERLSQRADGRGGRPGGIEAAARELGIQRQDAHRAVAVAGLADEAKEAAREAGLDDNRSALLAASREPTPEAQVAKIINYEPRKDGLASIKAAYRKLSEDEQREFRDWLDKPIMDQRYA
jgi:ParB-like chromosome segregation protein Spo0J